MKEIKSVDGIKPLSKEQQNKHEFNKLWSGFKTTCRNVESFVMTISLMVVSTYAGYTAYKHMFAVRYVREVILFCATLIGIQAFWLLWKHINKK